MKRYVLISALLIVVFGVYGLNRGIYVGSERRVSGYRCCPDADILVKSCRYLFVTGVSEIRARGSVDAPRASIDENALSLALKKPDNSYCHLFAD